MSTATPRWAATTADRLLPEFPWNRLAPLWEAARRHPDGVIDLSIGAPVDPTPDVIRRALVAAVDAPGYPSTEGPVALRAAIVDYLARRAGVQCLDVDMVLPTIGSKEVISQLPAFLGLGADDVIAIPDLGYPTYEIGALSTGTRMVRYVDPRDVDTEGVAVLWINSPSNPEGRILSSDDLRMILERARRTGTLVVSDECYLEFGWTSEPTSILHPDVCGNDTVGILICSSLSKRSNLAGYRAGFLAGDGELLARLLEYRKHMGQMVPTPVQAAMTAALEDDAHVALQREIYLQRRAAMRPSLEAAGFVIDHSDGGLYFWVRREGETCWQIAEWMADRGIIAVPGEIYGESGRDHVRLTITTGDNDVARASQRLMQHASR
ncbi:succinyldiaminopimelate transaminase [Aeromicrobium sp. A1-2]|uniref:succinyldiaminopimelate transaminase n=1 Tax=Aeromicrobium sp. A1-2 TaxID=2107713 RepID=UPI000E4980D1|nr:succinyldiaminopimelate transaminase [Aeromicrobium sp. A1-2]AXT84158.1 succinyldiaminopimelate transaminase [Aeromicrobium sp. A1-2]